MSEDDRDRDEPGTPPGKPGPPPGEPGPPPDEESGTEPGDGGEAGRGGGLEWVGRRLPGYTDATHGEREVPDAEVLAHEHAVPRRDEHDFEPDVERIHRPIFREPRDPLEGREPAPWWVWAAVAVSLFWGGWYLGRHGGTLSGATHIAFARLSEYVAEERADEQATAAADPVRAGAAIYAQRCQQCHQQSGRGIAGVFPPLVGSEWVTGAPETVVRILLHGLQGPIEVEGRTYDGAMPGWRELLSNAEIAAVSTYIRQLDANAAGPVAPGLVAELRAATADRTEAWTAGELRAAEASGPGGGGRP